MLSSPTHSTFEIAAHRAPADPFATGDDAAPAPSLPSRASLSIQSRRLEPADPAPAATHAGPPPVADDEVPLITTPPAPIEPALPPVTSAGLLRRMPGGAFPNIPVEQLGVARLPDAAAPAEIDEAGEEARFRSLSNFQSAVQRGRSSDPVRGDRLHDPLSDLSDDADHISPEDHR